jgi:hypothetical protein
MQATRGIDNSPQRSDHFRNIPTLPDYMLIVVTLCGGAKSTIAAPCPGLKETTITSTCLPLLAYSDQVDIYFAPVFVYS